MPVLISESVGFHYCASKRCRILRCFVFGAATCSPPLASSWAAERKTASALQPPCQLGGCPNLDSDGNRTRLVKQNSVLPIRKVTSSSFSFLLRREIPNARLKIPPRSHFSRLLLLFPSLVYTSPTLVCSRQLEERAIRNGVSMATGMRLISKVRVKIPEGAQGRRCLPL